MVDGNDYSIYGRYKYVDWYMENSLSVAMLKEIPEYLQKTIRIEKKRSIFKGFLKMQKIQVILQVRFSQPLLLVKSPDLDL